MNYNWKWVSLEWMNRMSLLNVWGLPCGVLKCLRFNIKSNVQRWNPLFDFEFSDRVHQDEHSPTHALLFSVPPKIAKTLWRMGQTTLEISVGREPGSGIKHYKGGKGLPHRRDDYCAAQMRPLVRICSLSYTSGWKEIEGAAVKVFLLWPSWLMVNSRWVEGFRKALYWIVHVTPWKV